MRRGPTASPRGDVGIGPCPSARVGSTSPHRAERRTGQGTPTVRSAPHAGGGRNALDRDGRRLWRQPLEKKPRGTQHVLQGSCLLTRFEEEADGFAEVLFGFPSCVALGAHIEIRTPSDPLLAFPMELRPQCDLLQLFRPRRASSLWWNPGERRERGGARLTRRVREEYRVYFDRNATQSAAKRRGSGGMHRRSNAAWVSLQAASVVQLRQLLGGPPAHRDHHRRVTPH